MFVYRVEHKYSKNGPYIGTFNLNQYDWQSQSHTICETHPLPYNDGIGDLPNKFWLCGFSTIVKLLQWFTKEELLKLYEYDFHIVRIKIHKNSVKIGYKQVIFNSNRIITKENIDKNALTKYIKIN